MNVLPVITRELRAQARQPMTYWLRVLGAGALMLMLVFATMSDSGQAGAGVRMFSKLHTVLFASIWILVPLSAADCISRERREGTLGLLFLTPLKARDIVLAKGLAYGSRAGTLWLSALPALVIPFLLGGVAWSDAAMSCAITGSSLALALGASILASAFCRQWHRALTIAFGMAVISIAALGVAMMIGWTVNVRRLSPSWFWAAFHDPIRLVVEGVFFIASIGENFSQWLGRMPPAAQRAVIGALVFVVAVSLLVAFGMMLLAARVVGRRWRDQERSVRAEKLEKTFCRPVVGRGWLRRWLRWRLNRNPIGWLELRTWNARVVVWLWLGITLPVCSYVIAADLGSSGFQSNFTLLQAVISGLLVLSLMAAAAGSFRRERETGVLELLLVSPLSASHIIFGRLRALWAQFLPSVGMLIFTWLFAAYYFPDTNPETALWLLSSFVALPVIGLRNSLAYAGYVGAFIATAVMGCIVPVLAANVPVLGQALEAALGLRWLSNWPGLPPTIVVFGVTVQLLIAISLLVSLHTNLVQRRFALDRSTA